MWCLKAGSCSGRRDSAMSWELRAPGPSLPDPAWELRRPVTRASGGQTRPCPPMQKKKKKNTKPYPLPVTFGKICFVDSIPNLLEPSALPSFQPRTELIQTSLWPFSWLPCHPILIPSSTHGENTSLLMPSWSPSLLTTLPHFLPPLILTPLLTLSLEGDIFISTLQRGLGAPQETPSQLPWFKFWTPV